MPDRRHVVHRGRRVGTLTRNGGQWVFRFATTIDEEVVQALADRIGDLVAEVEAATQAMAHPERRLPYLRIAAPA